MIFVEAEDVENKVSKRKYLKHRCTQPIWRERILCKKTLKTENRKSGWRNFVKQPKALKDTNFVKMVLRNGRNAARSLKKAEKSALKGLKTGNRARNITKYGSTEFPKVFLKGAHRVVETEPKSVPQISMNHKQMHNRLRRPMANKTSQIAETTSANRKKSLQKIRPTNSNHFPTRKLDKLKSTVKNLKNFKKYTVFSKDEIASIPGDAKADSSLTELQVRNLSDPKDEYLKMVRSIEKRLRFWRKRERYSQLKIVSKLKNVNL